MGVQYERRRLLRASLALLAMGAAAPAGRTGASPWGPSTELQSPRAVCRRVRA